MTRTPNRLRSGERGAVGMMIIMWLAIVVLLGITAIDAGSIAFTKFRLADVASTASTAAANAFRTSPNTVTACQVAEASIAAEDPSAKLESLPDAVSTPELNIQCAEGEPHALVARLAESATFPGATEVIRIDGLRVEYPDGFGLARASNTTPVIVLRFEADNPDALARIQEDFRRVLTKVKPGIALPY